MRGGDGTLQVVLVGTALLATGSLAVSTGHVKGDGAEEYSVPEVISPAREFVEFGIVKRRIDPFRSLDDWREEGFAFEDKREPEFEALRVNEVKSANKLRRYHLRDLTLERFKERLEPTHQPFVIEGIPEVENWKASEWTIPLLEDKYPTMQVKVGVDEDKAPVKMSMADFARYTRTQKDDVPLYVFDYEIFDDEVGRDVMSQYSVPDIFTEDLLKLVEGHREYPAYRWLLLGPKRSGSATHNDPLATSAWNTLISGRKLWFLAPPYMENLIMDTRDTDVATWFIDVLPELRAKYEDEITMYVQQPGETMFVPAFWMHAVLNLDDTVAVTQNFISSHTFAESWGLVKSKLPRLSKKWLQELVVKREDLALLALRLNVAQRRQQEERWRYEDEDDDED